MTFLSQLDFLDRGVKLCDAAVMDLKRSARLTVSGILLLVLTAFGSCLAFYLPSTEKVRIAGTEIKRKDAKDGTPMHDVRYIQAITEKGDSIIFRNEDTRWGFPFYFKFNSSDLSGEAQEIAKSKPEATVLVTYYGIRSQVLDVYPNAVGLLPVEPGHVHVPIFNIVFVVVLVSLGIAFVVLARRATTRIGEWWAKLRQ